MVIICFDRNMIPFFYSCTYEALLLNSATRILGVRKIFIQLPDQLIMISCRRCKYDANITIARNVVRRYASIGNFTLIT